MISDNMAIISAKAFLPECEVPLAEANCNINNKVFFIAI